MKDRMTRWMSFELIRTAIAEYPGPKVGLVQMTEEYLANHETVLATRIKNGRIEYLLNLQLGCDAQTGLF